MAIKYLAGNRLVGDASDDTKPTLTSAVAGTTFLDFYQDLYRWDGDSWELVTGNTIAENLQNKTFLDYCLVSQVGDPGSSVGADKGAIYVKSDGKFYGKFENETPIDLTIGAGATSLGTLTDTTIGGVTLADGHLMVYTAGGTAKWLNKPLSGATGTTATLSAAGELGITTLTVLTDLDMVAGNKTIFDTVGANTITFAASGTQTTFPGNVTVSGNFTVSGTTTTISTTNTIIADHLLELNTGATSNADDTGIIIERGSTGDNAIFVWDESADGFIVGTTTATADATSNITIAAAPFQASAITGTTGTFAGLANNAGALTTNNKLVIDVANSALPGTLSADGQLLHIDALTFTDGTTSSGTAAQNYSSVSLEQATIAASASSITTTRAATLNIVGAPVASTNMTLTDTYALYVAGGASHFVGAITSASSITGATLVSSGLTTLDSLIVTGATSLRGAIGLGDGTGDVITFTGRVADGAILPANDNLVDLGGSSNEFKDLYIDGTAHIDAIAAATTIDTPAITGGTAIELTILSVRDNAGTHDLEIQSATTSMSADRILIFDVNNVNRTVSLSGNVTLGAAVTTVGAFSTAGAFTTSGAYTTTLTATANTTVTLPITGTLATLAGDEILTTKTINSPKIGTALLDSAGDEMIKFTPSGGTTVNEFTFTNTAANGSPSIAATGTDTHINLTLKSKGTDGVIIASTVDNGAYIEFQQKAAPADMTGGAVEYARLYLKNIDTNNNALAVKIQKAGAVREVEITSPKAICGECGSKDGALDPTYDFSRSIMIVELWCGHSYEVPMNGWNMVS